MCHKAFLKYFLFLLISIPLSISAQNKKKRSQSDVYVRSRKLLEPLPFSFAATGSLNFYGVKLGVDYPLKMVEIRGFMGSLQGQRINFEQYLSTNIGLWHYDGIHENAYANLEWTLRYINNKGYFWQMTPIGIGGSYLLKSFTPAKTIADSVPNTQKFYITPSVSFGIGRDFAFNRHRAKPLAIYLKGGVSAMYPFQKLAYIFPTAEMGMSFRFSGINVFVKKTRRD